MLRELTTIDAPTEFQIICIGKGKKPTCEYRSMMSPDKADVVRSHNHLSQCWHNALEEAHEYVSQQTIDLAEKTTEELGNDQ